MNLSVQAAKQLVHSGLEVAFLDIREAAAFGDGHPLFAVPCPYSQLEHRAARLVPRLDVPVLLIDGGDGLAKTAARRLAACGYSDVRTVIGGVPAWQRAGFGIFAGVNVPSKTLGELLEHRYHPQTITPQILAKWQRDGRPFHFFDARPPGEFRKMRIAGAHCLPNGELAHRLNAVVSEETAPIVVTCAGRTRGIIGALGLRASGVRNPIYALENGTQGWALAGFPLDRGASAGPFPDLSDEAREASWARAEGLRRSGVSFITSAEAQSMLAEAGRTTFVFDVRTSDEQNGLPCPGAETVLGGQLVQATDQHVGVRKARLILIDDTGLRGALAAVFLSGLGLEPHVVALGDGLAPVHLDRCPARLPTPHLMSVSAAMQAVEDRGTPLIDLRPSTEFEAGHLQGAVWSIRPRLADLCAGRKQVILFGPAPVVAAAAVDLEECGIASSWLDASLEDCKAAGWRVEPSAHLTAAEAIDRVWFVHDRHDGNREASLRYLAWETVLVEQLDEQERAEFAEVRLPI